MFTCCAYFISSACTFHTDATIFGSYTWRDALRTFCFLRAQLTAFRFCFVSRYISCYWGLFFSIQEQCVHMLCIFYSQRMHIHTIATIFGSCKWFALRTIDGFQILLCVPLYILLLGSRFQFRNNVFTCCAYFIPSACTFHTIATIFGSCKWFALRTSCSLRAQLTAFRFCFVSRYISCYWGLFFN